MSQIETAIDHAMDAMHATMSNPDNALKFIATCIAAEFGVDPKDLIVLYTVETSNEQTK